MRLTPTTVLDMAFSFNSRAKYQTGASEELFSAQAAITSDALINPQIQVRSSDGFQVKYQDLFEKYFPSDVEADKVIRAWQSTSMQFWQNQVNFVIWCATAGCGVSAQDHLSAPDKLIRSLYLFHTYYQIRRILNEIQAPLPQDQAWDAFNNPYDRRAFERICNEFGVSPHSNWRNKGPNNGLGLAYFYTRHFGYIPVQDGHFDPDKMSFTGTTTNDKLHVDYIAQGRPDAWKTSILDKSDGFTQPGVNRLNDSIRTYVWAILGAQAQTLTGILTLHGNTTSFDAQKQFLANIEDAISAPVDLPSAIKRYQDVLQYAGSKVNFAFGIGLYMAPADMLLRVGNIVGYNNEIVVATADQKLGLNSDINAALLRAPTDTGETGLVKPQTPMAPAPQPAPVALPQLAQAEGQAHSDGLTALVVGVVALGLGWLALRQ